MKWILIKESRTPSDIETINASFNHDVSDEKYTPSIDFMKTSYWKLNNELFHRFLPSNLKFSIVYDFESDVVGHTISFYDSDFNEYIPSGIVLNGKFKLTLHNWIEAMLHEMVHVCEYIATESGRKGLQIGKHSSWFMNKCRTFDKYGFHVDEVARFKHDVAKKEEVDMEMMDKFNLFAVVGKTQKDIPMVIRISEDKKNECISELKEQMKSDSIDILKTKNPNSNDIEEFTPNSIFRWKDVHVLDNPFKLLYGPFEEVKNTINESNEWSDKDKKTYEMLKNKPGIIKVRRIKEGKFEVHISDVD